MTLSLPDPPIITSDAIVSEWWPKNGLTSCANERNGIIRLTMDTCGVFAHSLLRISVAQTISNAGLTVTNESTLETLTDVAQTCKGVAWHE